MQGQTPSKVMATSPTSKSNRRRSQSPGVRRASLNARKAKAKASNTDAIVVVILATISLIALRRTPLMKRNGLLIEPLATTYRKRTLKTMCLIMVVVKTTMILTGQVAQVALIGRAVAVAALAGEEAAAAEAAMTEAYGLDCKCTKKDHHKRED